MNKKWLGISVGVVGVCFVLAALAEAIVFDGDSNDIGSGKLIGVKKTVTPYQDWNTGAQRERTENALTVKGAEVSADDLKKWLDVEYPGLAPYPTIHDAVELQPNDFLLMLAKDSQGTGYLLMRVQQGADATPRISLVKLGEEESAYNWFPDSRVPGWSRAIAKSGAQYMIRHSPFSVVTLGRGELAKVDLPFAFVVSDERDEEKIQFRVIDLNSGKTISSLNLNKSCFDLPTFSFNHPRLDAFDKTEDDEYVKYRYGPKWWDKNIEWAAQPPTLKLRKNHTLFTPPTTIFRIHHDVPQAAEPRTAQRNCGGQVIPDTTIGFCTAIFRS